MLNFSNIRYLCGDSTQKVPKGPPRPAAYLEMKGFLLAKWQIEPELKGLKRLKGLKGLRRSKRAGDKKRSKGKAKAQAERQKERKGDAGRG